MKKRQAPAKCQHEPPFPDHDTVTISIRSPDLVAHQPSDRCVTEEPHAISRCGEFDPLLFSKTVHFKCTPEQKVELQRLAEAQATTISGVIRRKFGWPDAELGNPRLHKQNR